MTTDTARTVLRRVSDLHVQCSLRVRNFDSPGIAMSDCCRAPAVTAVEMEDGRTMWRCVEHVGIRSIERGPVHLSVHTRVQ